MSESDELARLRVKVDALQDILVATIKAIDRKAVRYSASSHPPPTSALKVIDAVFGELDAKLEGRSATHTADTVLREFQVETAYAEAVVELEKALKGI